MDNTENQKPYFDIYEDPNVSEREKYKYYIQNDNSALELKEKVKKTVIEKGFGSTMNDTKWLKLQSSIEKLPFPPHTLKNLYMKIKLLKKCK